MVFKEQFDGRSLFEILKGITIQRGATLLANIFNLLIIV